MWFKRKDGFEDGEYYYDMRDIVGSRVVSIGMWERGKYEIWI